VTKGAMFGPRKESKSQISVLTLGTLYEAILSFSSEERFDSFWPSVCQNARWLIPFREPLTLSGLFLVEQAPSQTK